MFLQYAFKGLLRSIICIFFFVKFYFSDCRVDFKSGIFVESKSGMEFVRSAFDSTLFELSDCC